MSSVARMVPWSLVEVGVADEAVAGLVVPLSAESWMTTYRSCYAAMVRLASLLISDGAVAEDIVQDAFARLIEAGAKVNDPAAYLRSVVVKRSRSHIRRVMVARRYRAGPPVVSPGPQEQVERNATAQEVRAAVAGLPQRQREAVVLRYLLELPDAEVAAAMGVSTGSVKTHLHRARAALGQTLGAQQ